MRIRKIAVLCSGGGSNLQSIIDNINSGVLNAKIVLVVTDRKSAFAYQRALDNNIPAVCIERKQYKDRDEHNKHIFNQLIESQAEFLVLSGYLSILSCEIVEHFKNKIINIHPSLIPLFCGMGYYGIKVHQAVVDSGMKISGATVHFVDEGTDTGPIIMQEAVPVYASDDAETLAQRVLQVEHVILPKVIKLLINDELTIHNNKVYIGGVDEKTSID